MAIRDSYNGFREGATDASYQAAEAAAERAEKFGHKVGSKVGAIHGDPLGSAYNAGKKTVGGVLKGPKWAARKAWGAGKIAGLLTALGIGGVALTSYLSSKRAASEEKLANEPADLTPPMQPSMPMMASQQMAMDPRTGFTPPVEAEWVERTGRGGQQAGFVQPEQMVMPASHVDAVQSRSSDKGEMAVTA